MKASASERVGPNPGQVNQRRTRSNRDALPRCTAVGVRIAEGVREPRLRIWSCNLDGRQCSLEEQSNGTFLICGLLAGRALVTAEWRIQTGELDEQFETMPITYRLDPVDAIFTPGEAMVCRHRVLGMCCESQAETFLQLQWQVTPLDWNWGQPTQEAG